MCTHDTHGRTHGRSYAPTHLHTYTHTHAYTHTDAHRHAQTHTVMLFCLSVVTVFRFTVTGIVEGQLCFSSEKDPSRFLWQHIDGKMFYYYHQGPSAPTAMVPVQRLHRLPPLGKGWLRCNTTTRPSSLVGGIGLGDGEGDGGFHASVAYRVPALEKVRTIAEGTACVCVCVCIYVCVRVHVLVGLHGMSRARAITHTCHGCCFV